MEKCIVGRPEREAKSAQVAMIWSSRPKFWLVVEERALSIMDSREG